MTPRVLAVVGLAGGVRARSARVVIPRDAATVMLVRDAPDLHVFMGTRNADSVWIAGASVFPGGAIDPEDRHPGWEERCRGWDDARASAALGIESGGLGFWVGAVRETFEEVGVLLARRRDGAPIDARSAEFVRARLALNAGQLDFRAFVTAHDLLLSSDALHLLSHWITPEGSSRRYDTRFFVGAAPEGAYEHDNAELIASAWIRPREALVAADRGELDLILPTRRNLEMLARYESAADLLSAAHVGNDFDAAGRIPFVAELSGGRRIQLPPDRDASGRKGALPCPT